MDRVPANALSFRQGLLADANVRLLVPQTALDEVFGSLSPAQWAMISGQPGGAEVLVIPDAPKGAALLAAEAADPNFYSARFNGNDGLIVNTASVRGLCLATTNARMVDQVRSHPGRRALWGNGGAGHVKFNTHLQQECP
jgi:hypothetical protein